MWKCALRVSHHGHSEHQGGDEEDRRLAVTLPQLVECVEEICPTHNPQEQTKHLRADRERTQTADMRAYPNKKGARAM